MKPFLRAAKAQALVELALVLFLFSFVIMGICQFVMLGQGLIKCQLAARKAAWIESTFNHLNLRPEHRAQVNALAPGCKVVSVSGNRETGKATTVELTVPAIGLFRAFKPEGFTLHATSAVIAYNEKPKAAELVEKGMGAISDFWNRTQ